MRRLWTSYSRVGLVSATIFFAASLTPSLLPRNYIVQGLLAGLALSAGYAGGVLAIWLWCYLELPVASAKSERIIKRLTAFGVTLMAISSLWRATVWQNSIRELMEMQPLETAYPTYVALIAVAFGIVLIGGARILAKSCGVVGRHLNRMLPRRVANVLSAVIVGFVVLMMLNRVLARQALNFADAVFQGLDELVDEGIEQPTDGRACGSAESLIDWDSIGRRGKDFIATGPTQEQLSRFWGREALRPLRVYVGLRSAGTAEERAELALQELQRVGGFDRSLLVVATPTGTGWLDPGGVDTLEFLHAGNTAIVSVQYSYLPSWITILVDPNGSRDAARSLFDAIYGHWRTLSQKRRPQALFARIESRCSRFRNLRGSIHAI